MISYKKFTTYDGSLYRDGYRVLSNMNLFTDVILNNVWSPILWRNNHRTSQNFLESSFLVLDFDTPGEETMEEVNHSLQDHKRIIATTRSHQKEKNGIICDRFRLIIPFNRTITDLKTYQHNYRQALKKYHWADKSCTDGARFFFPSKELFVVDRESDYKWEVLDFEEANVSPSAVVPGVIPAWALNMINSPWVEGGARNDTVYKVACALAEAGFTSAKAREIVLRMKMDFKGVGVEQAVKSAYKKFGRVK